MYRGHSESVIEDLVAVVQYRGCFSALTITLTHVQTESFPHNANITVFAAWPRFLVFMLTDRSFFHILLTFHQPGSPVLTQTEYLLLLLLISCPSNPSNRANLSCTIQYTYVFSFFPPSFLLFNREDSPHMSFFLVNHL